MLCFPPQDLNDPEGDPCPHVDAKKKLDQARMTNEKLEQMLGTTTQLHTASEYKVERLEGTYREEHIPGQRRRIQREPEIVAEERIQGADLPPEYLPAKRRSVLTLAR